MALHERETVREQLEDCVFADRDLTRPVRQVPVPAGRDAAREAFQLVADELMLDGNARQNLATFCQTWEEPEVLALMALSINKNMIDRDEYPQTAEIERRCVHMMADLWNAPDAANTVGTSAIGSSEACMLAGMAAKWRWRAKRRAEGKPTDRPNMVCGPVQVVWHKFARYWDIEMREVPMSHGHYMMDAASMLERVDENTIMVVPDARRHLHRRLRAGGGDVQRAGQAAGRHRPGHRHSRGRGQRRFPRPVLRARGRLRLPAAPGQVDQRLGAQVRAGSAGRRLGHLPGPPRSSPMTSSSTSTTWAATCRCSRSTSPGPAGQVIASYYNFLRLGHEGYRRIHQASYDIGQYLAAEIVKLGPFELLCDSNPDTGIPTVTWRIREGEDPGYTLFDLADRLRGRGWQVPAYTLTGTASDIAVQRILVRLGVSRDMAALLLDDFRDAVAHFGKHPVTVSMTKEESGGFSHL